VNASSVVQADGQGRFKSRSMGMKLIVVCGLALVMTIPALFVSGLVDERTGRAAGVVKEISGYVGGQQTFLGPTLAIPYTVPAQTKDGLPEHGIYLVFPIQSDDGHSSRSRSSRRICNSTRPLTWQACRWPLHWAHSLIGARRSLW